MQLVKKIAPLSTTITTINNAADTDFRGRNHGEIQTYDFKIYIPTDNLVLFKYLLGVKMSSVKKKLMHL